MRVIVLALLLTFTAFGTASANHGMVTLPECSTHTFDADLTKGRTNSIVVHVDHSVTVRAGCVNTYHYTNYVGADREDQLTNRETSWQMAECQRVGKLDTVNLFNYGFHQTINGDDVRVSCKRYSGPD